MRRYLVLALALFIPLASLAGLVVVDRMIGLPGRGQDYVVSVDLPPAEGVVGLPKVEGPMDATRPLVVIDPDTAAGTRVPEPGRSRRRN